METPDTSAPADPNAPLTPDQQAAKDAELLAEQEAADNEAVRLAAEKHDAAEAERIAAETAEAERIAAEAETKRLADVAEKARIEAEKIKAEQEAEAEATRIKEEKAQADAEAERIAAQERDVAPDIEEADLSGLLPGGVSIPDGFALVGKVSYADDSKRVNFDDLFPNVKVENHIVGISAALNQPAQGSNHGYIEVRFTVDQGGIAYLFRQNAIDTQTTTFTVGFGHGVA